MIYRVEMNHCNLTFDTDSFIVEPTDNDYLAITANYFLEYSFDIPGFMGTVDRTRERNCSILCESVNIGTAIYKNLILDIRELPSNKSIEITLSDRNGKVIYQIKDTIIKGGKYDED